MPPPEADRATGPALEAMYRFVLWLVPTIEKFPRSQRFLLGDRIQTTALDVVEALIDATHSRDRRKGLLTAANRGLQKIRLLCRLAHELRYLDHCRYEHAALEIDAVGRLVGGWQRSVRQPL